MANARDTIYWEACLEKGERMEENQTAYCPLLHIHRLDPVRHDHLSDFSI